VNGGEKCKRVKEESGLNAAALCTDNQSQSMTDEPRTKEHNQGARITAWREKD